MLARRTDSPVASRSSLLVRAWPWLLSLLMLGPALGPGFVLTYDMVFVPDLALRADFLGLGSGLPRAVPSDAVVAVVDEVVPGEILQKIVLLGSLGLGGAGAARLVATLSVPARLMATTVWVWNPFVVERLAMGHWTLLVCYGALPWLVQAAQRWRQYGESWPRLAWLLSISCLSPSAGVISAVVLLCFASSGRARRDLVVLALLAAANAPWVTAGLLHRQAAVSDASGALAFSLMGEAGLPAPVTALTLGGIWNREVVPASQEGPLAWLLLALFVVLMWSGFPRWGRCERGDRARQVALWMVGWTAAVATWAAPELLAVAFETVPGSGLLRDGARMLALCAPLLTVLVAHGVERIMSVLDVAVTRFGIGAALVLAPIAVMPDAVWGLAGRMAAVSYPPAFAEVRAVVGGARGDDVLLLPFTSYRAPSWNHGRKVLDPWGRYLRPDYVANDELVVSGVTITGEDPRAHAVGEAVAAGDVPARSRALAALGIAVVVTDHTAPGTAPVVSNEVMHRAEGVTVSRIDNVTPYVPPLSWLWAMALAWVAFVTLLAAAAVAGAAQLARMAARGRAAC